MFYKILKIVFAKKVGSKRLTYEIHEEIVDIFADSNKVASIKVQEIKVILKRMLENLSIKNEGRAFPLKAGSECREF